MPRGCLRSECCIGRESVTVLRVNRFPAFTREATSAVFQVFGMARLEIEPSIPDLAVASLCRCQAKFLTCEISDFTPCAHAQSN